MSDSQAIPLKKPYADDPAGAIYSSTPGGTLFSTTPGGTKIVYEKSFLLHLRQSPISKTPPTFSLPDNLIKGHNNSPPKNNNHHKSHRNHFPRRNSHNKPDTVDAEQFQIDI